MSDREPNSTDSGGSQADVPVNNANQTPASQEGSVEPPLISIQKRKLYTFLVEVFFSRTI